MHYVQTNPKETPHINTKNIASDISHQFLRAQTLFVVSVKPPSFLSPTPLPSSSPLQDQWLTLPPSQPPTPSPTPVLSPVPTEYAAPSIYFQAETLPTPSPIPAKKITPPTPTPKRPAPAASSPITSAVRPGASLDEVFADVAKRMCVPVPLMKAIQSMESGERMQNYIKNRFRFFNTYGWWSDPSITQQDLFYLAAYSAQTGMAPSDTRFAGVRIAKALQPNAYDQKIMGLMQISQDIQDKTFKNTSKVITSGKIDRRVIYDNVLIFSSALLNQVGSLAETGCGDWSFRAIARAACKHNGVCRYNYSAVGGKSGNYCIDICNKYNEYAGTHYDCGNAPALMDAEGNDGQCTLK